ncbi:hypothetical protein WLQ65_19295 [Pseudoalteromonas piscicida]|uniref:hypothetical protein n=1 Tax=Pseudoalteromonas piscicida TaxID=43662 RepID=UPI0030C98CB1
MFDKIKENQAELETLSNSWSVILGVVFVVESLLSYIWTFRYFELWGVKAFDFVEVTDIYSITLSTNGLFTSITMVIFVFFLYLLFNSIKYKVNLNKKPYSYVYKFNNDGEREDPSLNLIVYSFILTLITAMILYLSLSSFNTQYGNRYYLERFEIELKGEKNSDLKCVYIIANTSGNLVVWDYQREVVSTVSKRMVAYYSKIYDVAPEYEYIRRSKVGKFSSPPRNEREKKTEESIAAVNEWIMQLPDSCK